ncbi:Trm112 family protein [Skermanella rosea]|uniref:Trm112 family protein n=1 Tax=Skermanella rosea TaxID=1817965 RepID=UPI001E32F677|nr:Trm112 family protein [Skermanella rosea]UEM03511.1 Trm112 family protein [Skermanella rosea]
MSDTKPGSAAKVDPKLLEILVCPLTKGPLRYDAAAQELISDRAGLAYPIRDGIPIMLVDEARTLDADTAHPTHSQPAGGHSSKTASH